MPPMPPEGVESPESSPVNGTDGKGAANNAGGNEEEGWFPCLGKFVRVTVVRLLAVSAADYVTRAPSIERSAAAASNVARPRVRTRSALALVLSCWRTNVTPCSC